MPLNIWQHAGRRCVVSISGVSIVVRLLDGEDLVDERAVSSADQAITLAELWRSDPPRGSQLVTRRSPRNLPPPAAGRPRRDGAAAVPRVMWVDRR